MVGVFMFRNTQGIDFTELKTTVLAFLTMLLMPLTFSMATGLTIRFLSYIVIAVFTGYIKKNLPCDVGSDFTLRDEFLRLRLKIDTPIQASGWV